MYNYKKEAEALLEKMTLEEKVSQMLHSSREVKHLGIPAYNWWNEALHGVARSGVATMFPQAISLAASFDENLLEEIATVISDEARAKYTAYQEEKDRDIYKGLTLWSPNVNIFRDPRWGRGHETYGEDPYLTARLGVAFIKGLQGEDPNMLKTAACAKHFAVHSGPESMRHSFNAEVSDYDLWNTYLPAFEACVKEGKVEAVMGAYNRTNGEPCCGSKLLLDDILRKKWGFLGHVVSDCWAIRDFHENHGVTSNPVESVSLAVKNGCDVNCGNMFSYCVDAVKEGKLSKEDIDKAVTRLLITRMKLGMLGAPEKKEYTSIPYEIVDCDKHREFNLNVARKTLIMLKNDGCLPLHNVKTIGVIGPNADSRLALEGNYQGTASEHITPLAGIKMLSHEKGIRVMYAEGCHLFKDSYTSLSKPDDRLAEAIAVAKRSDAVVLCVGLDSDIEGEEGDRGNQFAGGDKIGLKLPGRQQDLIEKITEVAKGKPIILACISGSAIDLSFENDINAIFQLFYPGALGGLAFAEAIFGHISPEGKLPVTFYKNDKDLPDFCDYSMKNRTYRYFKGEALYPFGFGLGYSKFSISDAKEENEAVTVKVKNLGNIKTGETIQIYAKCENSVENWNLCGIGKVFLEPGESKIVKINYNKAAFYRYDKNGDLVPLEGNKTLYIGFCQPDNRSVELYGQAPLEIKL